MSQCLKLQYYWTQCGKVHLISASFVYLFFQYQQHPFRQTFIIFQATSQPLHYPEKQWISQVKGNNTSQDGNICRKLAAAQQPSSLNWIATTYTLPPLANSQVPPGVSWGGSQVRGCSHSCHCRCSIQCGCWRCQCGKYNNVHHPLLLPHQDGHSPSCTASGPLLCGGKEKFTW